MKVQKEVRLDGEHLIVAREVQNDVNVKLLRIA